MVEFFGEDLWSDECGKIRNRTVSEQHVAFVEPRDPRDPAGPVDHSAATLWVAASAQAAASRRRSTL